MSKVYLISDITNSFSLKLAKGLLDRDNIVVGLNSSVDSDLFNDGLKNINFHIFNWNRSSPLSASKVIKKTLNQFGTLDYAFISFSSFELTENFHEVSSVSVERLVDEQFKGSLYLTKELTALFTKSGSGQIGLVCNRTLNTVETPLDGISFGLFESLNTSLRKNYINAPFSIESFDSKRMIDSEFSSYILKSITDTRRTQNTANINKKSKGSGFSFFK